MKDVHFRLTTRENANYPACLHTTGNDYLRGVTTRDEREVNCRWCMPHVHRR